MRYGDGVAKSVHNFDAAYHDVTPIKLNSRPHYELRSTNANSARSAQVAPTVFLDKMKKIYCPMSILVKREQRSIF